MRPWAWVRSVIADRGEHAPIPIDLERTPGGGYQFRLGVRAGFGGHEAARIPVSTRPNAASHPLLKEIVSCEVAGQLLEAANVYALKDKVARLLEAVAPARSLPLCYFRVPDADYELPVYEDGGQIVSPATIGGPKLKADDLAGIRAAVCRYMVNAGYVSEPDQVAVGVVRPRDLSRVAPAAIFRSWEDPSLWLPSVEGSSPDGPVIGLLGHGAALRRRAQRRRPGIEAGDGAPSAPDVIALLRFVRSEIARTGERNPGAVYAAQVRPEIWAAAEERVAPAGRTLVAYLSGDEATRLELRVRTTGAGDVATALEDDGISVFLAADTDALAATVGSYLAHHDFLRFAQEVEVHADEPPRAERLEAEDIWTQGDGISVSPNEEVTARWS